MHRDPQLRAHRHSHALSVAAATFTLLAAGASATEPLKVYAYGAGTEWVVDGKGGLLQKARVLVQVELDEELGLVRETITAARPGYGGDDERQEVMTVTQVKRTSTEVTWLATSDKDGIRRRITAMHNAERLWIYEVWTDRADKIILYRVRDVSMVSERDFTKAMLRRTEALKRLSQ